MIYGIMNIERMKLISSLILCENAHFYPISERKLHDSAGGLDDDFCCGSFLGQRMAHEKEPRATRLQRRLARALPTGKQKNQCCYVSGIHSLVYYRVRGACIHNLVTNLPHDCNSRSSGLFFYF